MVMVTDSRLALYTVVYPAVGPFLAAWYESVRAQTDAEFDLWISLDGIDRSDAARTLGCEPEPHWVATRPGATIAEVRQHALELLVERYDAIVFVDADDLLHPTRIAGARAALASHDVVGCALRVVDGTGSPVGVTFGPSREADPAAMLPRWNVFGLSNTAYRAAVVRDALPIPADARLVDWLLATRAWAQGAALGFDREARMDYRQYGRNTARVLPPFTPTRIRADTALVLAHYDIALGAGWAMPDWCAGAIASARDRVVAFEQRIVRSEERLGGYVDALNRLEPEYVWWWSVAHPALEGLWSN
jgi:hypothetical protein